MAQFDIQYSTRIPSGEVAARPMVADTAAPYRALAQAGNAISEIGEDRLRQQQQLAEQEYKNKIYSEKENGKIALSEFDAETNSVLHGVTDPDEIQKIAEERLKKRSGLFQSFATTPESTQALDLYTRKTAVGQVDGIDALRFNKQKEKGFIAFDVRYQELAKNGQFDVMGEKAYVAYQSDIIDEREYSLRINQIPGLQKEYNINQVKSILPDAIASIDMETYDRTPAIAMIDSYVDDAVDLEILDAAESIDIRNDLINQIDDWRQERVASLDRQEKQTTTQAYRSLIDTIIDGSFAMDAVAQSSLKAEDVERWKSYSQGYFMPPPEKSELKGTKLMTDTIVQYSRGEISEPQAYDSLLKSRYVEREMDDKTFQFAVDKIRNRFPQHYAETLKSTLDVIEKRTFKTGGLGKTDFERDLLNKANIAVIDYAEQYYEKHGEYPDANMMYSKAREMGVSIRSQEASPTVLDMLAASKQEEVVAQPTTQAEYDAIPTGTIFIDTDGVEKRKL